MAIVEGIVFLLRTVGLAFALAACTALGTDNPAARPANGAMGLFPTPGGVSKSARQGIDHRFIVGYQGWFGCPGDAPGNSEWRHWFNGPASLANLTVEMLPVVDGLPADALCDTGLVRPDGTPVRVFSSQHPAVADAHFAWMQAHGIDGVALQRFVSEIATPIGRERADRVLDNVAAAAARHGRVFHVTYDISGADPATAAQVLRADWERLTVERGLAVKPGYLRNEGRPVVGVWGFGFADRPGTPAEALALVADLKRASGARPAAAVVGGVPAHWRTLDGDSRREPEWAAVYRAFDVISPWTVGRYRDDASMLAFVQSRVVPDLEEARAAGIGYKAVVFPGFSWSNLQSHVGDPSRAMLDEIPRRCGDFLWHQVHAFMAAGATAFFGAMFDEVDEATALMPTQASPAAMPVGSRMLASDALSCGLAADGYLGLAGRVAEQVRTGVVPGWDR